MKSCHDCPLFKPKELRCGYNGTCPYYRYFPGLARR